MHKAILIMLLTVVSSSAMAEWVYVAEDEEETFVIYVDLATIQKTGNRVKIWALLDYRTVQEPDFISVTQKGEYDCKEKQYRTLLLSTHSGRMANGETVFIQNEPDDWNPVTLDSVIGSALDFACGFDSSLPQNIAI